MLDISDQLLDVPVLKETESYNYYSISRLKTYQTCSYSYYHKYVLKTRVPSMSSSTLTGSFVHDALELLYSPEVEDDTSINYLIDALLRTAPFTIVEQLRLPVTDTNLFNLLLAYAQDAGSLEIRASASYQGKDAIRSRGGVVATVPSMTSAWKEAAETLNLSSRKQTIDTLAGIDPQVASIASAFSEAYNICLNYRTPQQIQEIIAVELPISKRLEDGTIHNPIKMPPEYGGTDDIYFVGFIDLVARIKYGGRSVLAIIDHKTSKLEATVSEVSCNRQLLAYANAYEELTGEPVEAIAINNMRANTLAIAPLDRNMMGAALHSIFSTHELIKNKHFVKQVPDDKYGACLSSFNKKCPYLEHCWPDYSPDKT